MIENISKELVFSFPEVHEDAQLRINFQRTLRIPDDDRNYSLPPGLGRFPLKHVDDCAQNVPSPWLEHGGILLPMYQSEAMWICFDGDYPFAVKVATGKINAVSGKAWQNGLNRDPQDYVVVPDQPWLDGFCVEEGVIRQFVAMPLGAGYTAEEQLTGEAEHGGLQILVYPIKREVYLRRCREQNPVGYCCEFSMMAKPVPSMGLAPGGRMKQQIYRDHFRPDDWCTDHSSRCFVHICNSMAWKQVTGEPPPTVPPTAKEYTKAGLPWFDYYSENEKALAGSSILEKLKSVVQMGGNKGALPENASVDPTNLVQLRKGLRPGQVREWKD